jgi:hypothetical protein
VDAAIREVCPEEIRYMNTLMQIRRLKLPPEHQPILKAFTTGWFQSLADEPESEIVFGSAGGRVPGGARHVAKTPAEFKTLDEPQIIKITMNFRIREVDANHCVLTTETRVYAAGPNMLHGFAAYWRMIYPGSSLIRRMWLHAIKLRAEREIPGV